MCLYGVKWGHIWLEPGRMEKTRKKAKKGVDKWRVEW